MLRLEGGSFSRPFALSIWLLMAFQAGYINVGGFIIFGSFVSHVTGTSSQIGMGVADLNFGQLLTFLIILAAFISGAAFSGHFLARRIEEGKKPRFILVSGVKSAFFAAVLFLSHMHFHSPDEGVKLLLIFLLSACCGIQNSSCAIATKGVLKPTHMTGLSTDIGIHLTKIFAWEKSGERYKEERKKNFLRLGILSFFIFGSCMAFVIFTINGHYGFLFPFLSSLCIFAVSIISEGERIPLNRPVFAFAKNSVLGVFLFTIGAGLYQLSNL